MTTRMLLGAALVVAAAASATAADTQADRDLKTVTTRLESAERILTRAPSYDRTAARLYAFEQAAVLFIDARRDAARWSGPAFESVWNDAGIGLVRAYDAQAEIYYYRGSLPSARRLNQEALEIDAQDPRARNLAVMIRAAEQEDIFDKVQGTVAVNRIVERRAAAGIPLRERGVATRR